MSSERNPLLSSANIAKWAGASWVGNPPESFACISTDSRKNCASSLFFAIKGEVHDAAKFIPDAARNGAAAAVATVGSDAYSGIPLMLVPDVAKAMGDIAKEYRKATRAIVCGITGSVGKTTVKEITASILATMGATAKTPGNFNNEIGLPISILSMPPDAKFGVLEAGMSHPREIAPLCAIMRPSCGIVTAIAPVHLEALKTIENIANEKADLLRAIPQDGFAVLDADGTFFGYLSRQCKCKMVSVSASGERSATVRATSFNDIEGSLTVADEQGPCPYRLAHWLPGVHNVTNALLAISAARELGATWENVRDGLASVSRPPMRWEISEWNGVRIINDAYNANPQSMRLALKTLAESGGGSRKIAVLGDMFELGAENEQKLHESVGEAAAKERIAKLLVLGERSARWIASAAIKGGMDAMDVEICASHDDAAQKLRESLKSGDAILFKASRGMAFEKIIELLRAGK